MIERIKQLMDENEISARKLTTELSLSPSAITEWSKGKAKPSTEAIAKIARYFNVSTDYLITGKEKAPLNKAELNIDNIFPINLKRFPLLGEIACGTPIFAAEDRESYILSGTDINADFCLKAKGDSMIGARIMDGDIVFIKEMSMVNNGEVAAVIIDDEATLKRVYYYPEQSKLILNAENPKYEPLVYIGQELNQIRILGKAVAFQSDVI